MMNCFIDNRNLRVEFLYAELDHHIAGEVREELDAIITEHSIKNIIFDFKNMKFMDSSGIGVVIGRYKKIAKDGGKVGVINVSTQVKKIFDLSGMNKIIGVYNTYEDAVSSF
jgi:stage II sporulation protein AA (anti-sigma F factor antagonist)